MKEIDLINNEKLRDQYIDHYEVLEKVKELLLIPGTETATMKQVAEYYKVDEGAIKMLVSRNRSELEEDGMQSLNGLETKAFLVSNNLLPTNERGYFEVDGIKFAYKSNLLFPRRAILRTGMLLRDSEIAKEVRTQLLNIEEKTSEETKIADITEEQQLALSVGMAYASGNPDAIIMATGKMMDFKNRHIVTLEQDNKALAGEILEWKDRSKLNAGIRKLSAVTRVPFKDLWIKLYKNLQYKYGIDLKSRNGGKKPYIANLKEEEWDKVLKSFSAMCKAYGQSPANMFQQTLSV
ncbi:hypothetical protein [Robinsoniella peoriensis]|uniref:hypothetical protein n=1 Tax=Robinsoniella peoriensis TaxID=180332 RepID=UPI00290AF03A|nr:hypothetical protein [Clostridiales bacterium]